MGERVGFSLRIHMDEFYLPEEIVEWLDLKKSEYLSKLIEHLGPDDFQFHEFGQFDDFLPMTLAAPDWSTERVEDGQRVKTYCRSFHDGKFFHQVVVGALIPDQSNNDVFIPILSFITKKENLLKLFSDGQAGKRLLS